MGGSRTFYRQVRIKRKVTHVFTFLFFFFFFTSSCTLETYYKQVSTDQNLLLLIMVACWYVTASLFGDLSLLCLCLHFTPERLHKTQPKHHIEKTERMVAALRIKTRLPLGSAHPHFALRAFIPPRNFVTPPTPSTVSVSLLVPQIRSQPIHKTLSLPFPVVSADSCQTHLMQHFRCLLDQVLFLHFDLPELQISEQQHIP